MTHSGYNLPDKLYFRIGEVSDILGVKPYVLRYWETEFGDIKPSKSKSGQRLYKKRDVELLLKIKDLLYDERFTISGAKQRLKELGREERVEGEGVPAAIQQSMFDAPGEAGPEKVVEVKVAPRSQISGGSEKKFLEKLKHDLEWCLDELRVEQ